MRYNTKKKLTNVSLLYLLALFASLYALTEVTFTELIKEIEPSYLPVLPGCNELVLEYAVDQSQLKILGIYLKAQTKAAYVLFFQ